MSTPTDKIPEETKIWYLAESRKKPMTEAYKEWQRRGQQLCFEVAYTQGYQDASEAMYCHLSQQSGLRQRLIDRIQFLKQEEAAAGWSTSHVKISYGAGAFYLEQVLRWLDESPASPTEQKTEEKPEEIVICPDCGGDGKETCHNPDHGFIEAMPEYMAFAAFIINETGDTGHRFPSARMHKGHYIAQKELYPLFLKMHPVAPIEAAEAKTEEKWDTKNWVSALSPEAIEVGIQVGDKIRIYGKATIVEGFEGLYNEGLEKWETIIHTTGRGDPFERSLDVIEVDADKVYTWKAAAPSTVEPILQLGIRWVKCVERMPNKEGSYPLRFIATGEYTIGRYGRNNIMFRDDNLSINTDYFEWLEESAVEPIAPKEKKRLVAFLDWFMLNYMNSKGATPNSSAIVVDRFIQQSQK